MKNTNQHCEGMTRMSARSKLNRFLSLILVMILLFSALPMTVIAADAHDLAETGAVSGTTGDCTWTVDGTVLTISGNGKMEDYRFNLDHYSRAPWSDEITDVIITEGVTSIGKLAFYDLNLKSVTIPESVMSIGGGAFSFCENVYISSIASWCTINYPEGYWYRSHNLILNGEPVIDLQIPESVTSISDGAFYGCTNLSNLSFPDTLLSVGHEAFVGTTWYDSQPDGIIYTGKIAYKVKGSCPADVSVSDGTVIISEGAFSQCDDLTSVTIPNSVIKIEDNAFADCKNLTNITVSDNVEIIGRNAFSGTAWYDNQPDGLIYVGKAAYKMKGDCPAEIKIDDDTCSISGGAFEDCTSLKNVTIPESVKSIGNRSFYNCTSLLSIIIPASVTSIGEKAFSILVDLSYCFDESVGFWFGEDVLRETVTTEIVIYGYTDSYAQTYAKQNGIYYISIVGVCNACGAPLTNDDYEITPGKPAGYFHTGESEGIKCSRCGEWLIEPEETPILTGDGVFCDVDGDGKVTVVDATYIQRWLVNFIIPFVMDEANGDADEDGIVTIIDVTYIQRWLAGLSANENIGRQIG